mgnify:CR=1 FL=1
MYYKPDPEYIAMCTVICESYNIIIIDKIILDNILYCFYKYNNIYNNIYLVIVNLLDLKF